MSNYITFFICFIITNFTIITIIIYSNLYDDFSKFLQKKSNQEIIRNMIYSFNFIREGYIILSDSIGWEEVALQMGEAEQAAARRGGAATPEEDKEQTDSN